jgi:hypothetical protein
MKIMWIRTLPMMLAALAVHAAPVTFHMDVEPILQKHCQGCHRPGEAAPFSLLSYTEARPWAKAIRNAVSTRKMPPWFADSGHGKFANDPRLSDAQIETIKAWADNGAVEGDKAHAPKALSFNDGWKIGKPDLVVEIPTEYPVPASGTVPYIWMAVDPKLTEDKWIEKIEVRPGDRAVVHHALVFSREPGSRFRSDLKPGMAKEAPERTPARRGPQNERGFFAVGSGGGAEMIADYVPNGDPFVAGPGQARFLHAGSHILFQMHYTASGKDAKDLTRIGIVFAKTAPKERIVNDAVMNMSLRIPPGAPNHPAVAVVTVQHDTRIGAFGPHMHLRGKAMKYELLRGEEAETLLYVPAYDFNWQLKYQPSEWVPVKKGDKLRVTAWFDNSPNNRFNPDPGKEVFWGDQSWSEMLFGFFDYVVPADVDPALVTGRARGGE